METKELLRHLCGAVGVSGWEDAQAAGVLEELAAPYGAVSRTVLGSVLCRVRQPGEGQPHLMLTAHMDQIGLTVTHIDSRGFLRAAAVGGVDRRLVMASQVTIHTQSGPLPGIIGSVPPHLQKGEAANPKMEDIAIDTGLPVSRVEKLVRLGDRVTFDGFFEELPHGRIVSPALDDRAGCAALLEAARLLAGERLGCGLSLLFACGEEVGGEGALTGTYSLAPSHVIAVDVTFADTPDAKPQDTGKLGGGPMVGFAPGLDHRTSKTLVSLAKREGIPFQEEIMGGRTGTDADGAAQAGEGAVTGLVSIPQRYMHTPVEMVQLSDLEDTARLLAAYARALGKEGQER